MWAKASTADLHQRLIYSFSSGLGQEKIIFFCGTRKLHSSVFLLHLSSCSLSSSSWRQTWVFWQGIMWEWQTAPCTFVQQQKCDCQCCSKLCLHAGDSRQSSDTGIPGFVTSLLPGDILSTQDLCPVGYSIMRSLICDAHISPDLIQVSGGNSL